jgi:hypothetical protein
MIPLREKVQTYSTRYSTRGVVILVLSGFFFLLTWELFQAFVFGLVIELYVVDYFTARMMPPAFMFLTESQVDLRHNDPLVTRLFLCVNGVWVIFLVGIVVWVS